MRTVSYSLRDLAGDLEGDLSDRSLRQNQIIRRVAARLKKLLGNKNALPRGATKFNGKRYGRHLLYKSKKNKFVVMALAWGPGQETPIHDHGTWGVAGVYKNILRVINYKLAGPRRNGTARLKLDSIIDGRSGTMGYVLPPEREIHKMANATQKPTISIHVYGKEMKSCNTFDLATNRVKRYTLSPPTIWRTL